jgi:hypothetical protein
MDQNGYYDYLDCTRLLYAGLKRSVQRELSETIRRLSLKEFLFKGAATGYGLAAGMSYLIAPVLASKIYSGISAKDIGPAVAADIIEDAKGETVYIPATFTRAYEAGEMGDSVPQGMQVNRASCTYKKYICPLISDPDMMEDSQYSLMDLAAKQAGVALAQLTNDQICSVLKRSTRATGMGTKQTASAGGDTTTPANVGTIAAQVASGGDTLHGVFHPNLLVCTPEVWHDALSTTAGHPEIGNGKYGDMNYIIVNSLQLGTVASNRLTNAVTFVLEKELALLIARKSWLRIENYADPRRGLMGAFVSARQACAELVDAAIGVLTET